MKFRKQVIAGLVVGLLQMLVWATALAAPPDITADAAIVVNEATGEVLFEKNADKREYPASMTKIMTCILALENGKMDRIVETSSNAADVECTRLQPGYQLRLGDMLQQMMMISDNGCATAVGETLAGGDIDYFAQLMNRKAQILGMTGSHFVNANGMPDSSHYSTARDMSKLACYAMQNQQFRRIVGTNEINIYYIQPQAHSEYCVNTNELLRSYPGCTGGKTGWTSAARGCLMAAAQRDGRELLVIVMHSADEDTRFSEAAALLDYGFSKKTGSTVGTIGK